MRAETRRTEQLNHEHSPSDSVHAALDLPRKVATDLLLFLKSFDKSARSPRRQSRGGRTALPHS